MWKPDLFAIYQKIYLSLAIATMNFNPMKKIFSFVSVFVFQLIVIGLVLSDTIYLATGVKLLLVSTAFYSIGIALYTRLFSKKIGICSWMISAFILLLTFVKVYSSLELIHWWHIWTLQFIQIHLFFILQQSLRVQKNRLHIVGGLFLALEAVKLLEFMEVKSIFLITLLCIYSVLILIGMLYKSENIQETLPIR